MITGNRQGELRGLRRLLPWSTRNFIANKLLEWSGSFADAAMWVAPEIREVASDEDDDPNYDRSAIRYHDFSDLPF